MSCSIKQSLTIKKIKTMTTKEHVFYYYEEKDREIKFFENDGSRLSKQLISLVDFSKGNNYVDTGIRVEIRDNSIVVSTFCTNEYGSSWSNENWTDVAKSDIPFFTAKKLGIV